MRRAIPFLVLAAALAPGRDAGAADGAELYGRKCHVCHGKDGKGDTHMGKKLGVKDLSRSILDESTIREVIARGLPDRQMPGYGDRITREELDALVAYVKGLAR